VRTYCIKGGRKLVSGKNKVKKHSHKQDCIAAMFVKISTCGKYLKIKEVITIHPQHHCSKVYLNKD
jgi:hypothetical protein